MTAGELFFFNYLAMIKSCDDLMIGGACLEQRMNGAMTDCVAKKIDYTMGQPTLITSLACTTSCRP